MKPIHVGYYQAGLHDSVEIRLVSGINGYFSCAPAKGKVAVIELGIDTPYQSDLYNVALHEITEWTMAKLMHRYAPTGTRGTDAAEYTFHFNHVQFTEICARVAMVLNYCMPDIVTHWRRYHRAKRKGKHGSTL